MIPQKVFFTKGAGKHKEKLQSFELALRDAGIARCNLVNVSSIFPPGCKIISREKGIAELRPGQITFVVMARAETNEPNRLVSASIGLAIPAEGENYGYLSEHHAFGMTEKKAGDYAEDLAATMLASTLGVEFDPDKAYDERKEIYKMSEKIVRTSSISQSALGDKNGLWTTVLAAAVFIPPSEIKKEEKETIQLKQIPSPQQVLSEQKNP
jgi:arginine decarboxylase